MVLDEGKKPKLDERAPEDIDDDELLLSVEKLQDIQHDLDKVTEEENDELMELEQKYLEIRRPVYLKRNEIIKTIPDFWLTSFLSHPVLGDLLSAEDQKIFKHFHSLDVEDFKDANGLGYSITFNFNENPYFEDTKLRKTFTFFDDEATTVTGTTIKWKEGMMVKGFANGVIEEKKGKKRQRAEESFFNWFNETEQKDIDGFHHEVAEIIKDDLWPNPLQYFNNEADEDHSEGDEDDEMENGDSDDGEDDNKGDS